MPDFLVTIDTSGIFKLPVEERVDLVAKEREAGLAHLKSGTLRNIWRVPGKNRNIGVWSAHDADKLHEVLSALPIFPYAEFDVMALATHPLVTGNYAYVSAGAS